MNKNHFFASALCGGAFALAFFASCTDKDLYDPVQAQALREAKYAKQFEKAFGKVDPNQDWGFGSASSTRATRAVESITVPSQTHKEPATSDFKTALPDGIVPFSQYYAAETVYLENGHNGFVNFYKGGTLYIGEGTYTLLPGDNGQAIVYGDGMDFAIYILPNANVTFKGKFCPSDNSKNPRRMYIAEGATVTFEQDTEVEVEIYNAGTINGTNLKVSNTGLLYNLGTIALSGDLSGLNADAEIINDGTITAASYGAAGSSSMFNNNIIVIKGATTINSNGVKWVNAGHFTTGSLSYTAGSTDVINSCYLYVHETLDMTLGDSGTSTFYIGGHGAVVAKNISMAGPSRFKLGSEAMLEATEKIVLDCTKDEYGIHGIGSDYAVVCAPEIAKGQENQGFEVSYSGKLYVATNKHFEQGYSGQYPYIHYMDDEVIPADGMYAAPISIAKTECSPGYNDDGKPRVTARYRVYAEDLGAEVSDWDFNDVVFDVIQYNTNKTDIVLQAAGGTLRSELEFVDGNGDTKHIYIHEEWGEPTTQMINTNVGTKTLPAVTKTFDGKIMPKDIEIYITYANGDRTAIRSEKGQAAGKFCINCTNIEPIRWMDEYVDIRTSYADFGAWVGNAATIWWPVTPAAAEPVADPNENVVVPEPPTTPNEPNEPNVDPQEPNADAVVLLSNFSGTYGTRETINLSGVELKEGGKIKFTASPGDTGNDNPSIEMIGSWGTSVMAATTISAATTIEHTLTADNIAIIQQQGLIVIANKVEIAKMEYIAPAN